MPLWARSGRDVMTHLAPFALPLILIVGAMLRFSDLNWDGGHLFHPDERHIFMVTDGVRLSFPIDVGNLLTPESSLNPRSFAYGSLIFYALRFVHWLVSAIADLLNLAETLALNADVFGLRFVGRALSGLFDLGTVTLTYLLGRELYGRRVGLLAAAFVAFSVIHIQLSHFYASDTPMTFLVTCAVLLAARGLRSGARRHTIGSAFIAGMALATKISASPVLAPVLLAQALRIVRPDDTVAPGWSWVARATRSVGPVASRAIALFLIALAAFIIFQPYAIIDSRTFLANIFEQNAMVRGAADVPYTRQYADRPAYWYFIENLLFFGVGPGLGLAMFAGLGYLIWRAIRQPTNADLLLLSLIVPYFLITGNFHAKFLRYMLPITPVLAVAASFALWSLYRWATMRAPRALAEAETVPEDDQEIAPERIPAAPIAEPAVTAQVESQPEEIAVLDEETRRWAEAKGLGLFGLMAEETRAHVLVVDEETRRWAELKGLSLFEELAVEEVAPAPAAMAPREQPIAPAERSPAPIPRRDLEFHEAGRAWTRPRQGALAVIALVLGISVFYGLAYQGVYAGEHTAVQASRWIYDNVPRGSTLANEHWEEGFPVAVRSLSDPRQQLDMGRFGLRQVPLNLYEADDERKLQHIASTLARTDYVLFFSNRLYGTIPRLPQRYPLTSRYYELLFGERLGFELVEVFSAYPSLFGVTFVDDTLGDARLPEPARHRDHLNTRTPIALNLGRADESFSVYDHPKILIFRKSTPLNETQIRDLLRPALPEARRDVAPGTPVYRSILQTPELAAVQRAGGTFRDLFNRADVANTFPLPVWILLLVVLTAVGAPIAVAALPNMPDRGLLFARPIALLLMTWIAWMSVVLTGIPAVRATALLGLILTALLSAVLFRSVRERILEVASRRRVALGIGEGLFWIAFLYFVWIRALNPDLWHSAHGGEKPMDLAYLMAAVKSATYPPYDPWFAGGILNYYYYGQLIVAQTIKVSGIIPTTAYNLALPMLYAMTASGAYAVAYTLGRRGGVVPERYAIGGGIFAAALATTLGNLGGAIQLFDGLIRLAGTSYASLVPGVNYLVLVAIGLFNWIVLRRPYDVPVDWYWPSTRVIPNTINEFPYFTFLYADLHAHAIALPFTVLAIAVATNAMLAAPTRLPTLRLPVMGQSLHFAFPLALPRPAWRVESVRQALDLGARSIPIRVVPIGVAALAIGALWPINSWDFPTYLGLICAATLGPWYLRAPSDPRAFGAAVIRAGSIVALSYLFLLPFHSTFVSFYSSVRPTPDQSSPVHYAVIHGLFLFLLISYVAADLSTASRASGVWRSIQSFLRRWDRFPHLFALRARLVREDDQTISRLNLVAAIVLVVIAAGIVFEYVLAAILLCLLALVVWRMLLRPRSHESAFVLLLFGTGLALSAAVEIVALDGDVGRMNTVFKFYLQVWVMWSIAAAAAAVAMRERLFAVVRTGASRAWGITMIVLVVAAAVYPIVSTPGKAAERFDRTIPPTLDGTAYMETAIYREDHPTTVRVTELRLSRDLRAIEWIWDNVDGSPVIAEANVPLYRWGSRISIYTGLPTILGWDWHQTQQRWGFRHMIEERVRDVRALYSDEDLVRTRGLLQKYNVAYIYVGDLERAYYPPGGLAKFDRMAGTDLDVVYDADGVKIYRVRGSGA